MIFLGSQAILTNISPCGIWTTGATTTETTVANGGNWAWPNDLEGVYLFVADGSWMETGQTMHLDDGVNEGDLRVDDVVLFEGQWLVQFGWLPGGPPGGTEMLDGATVVLVP